MTDIPASFRARFAELVAREVTAAHRDLVQDLADTQAELATTKKVLQQTADRLRDAINDLNRLRGVTDYTAHVPYDENGVRAG